MPNQFSHPWNKHDITFLNSSFNEMPYKEIGKILNRSYPSVQSKIRDLKLNKRVGKYRINSNFFKDWSSSMAYVLGFITADGNTQQTQKGYHIHVACDDLDVIEQIKECIQSDTPIRRKPRSLNNKLSYSLRFSDKTMFYDLLSLGVTPRKSLTIKPPDVPQKYLWDYIRSFFDGDGSVYIDKKRSSPSRLHTKFYTGSQYMATYLFQTIKRSITYKGNILKRKDKVFYSIHFGQKNSEELFGLMYNTSTLFMKRKYLVFLEGMKV